MANDGELIILRELTASDLGWFAEPRDRGQVASKQRALNINSHVVAAMVPEHLIEAGELYLHATCIREGCTDSQERILKKVGKNWRLGGAKVRGEVFGAVRPGDYFVGCVQRSDGVPSTMQWTVVFQDGDVERHRELSIAIGSHLSDRMVCYSLATEAPDCVRRLFLTTVSPDRIAKRKKKSPSSVRERLQQPSILNEMMKVALTLSGEAQQNFLIVLENTAVALREMLLEEGLIQRLEIDGKALWQEVAGKAIAFVDGGTANFASFGSEPVAIRVGSYVVVPGRADSGRESFRIEKQLVAELFERTAGAGLFDDLFEDTGKLRDVARISLEAAGALSASSHELQPEFVFLHGTLVNPVSQYALHGFPNFTKQTITLLLPGELRERKGKDANFVSTHLAQLQRLRDTNAIVCGVVERASGSQRLLETIFDFLKTSDISMGSSMLEDTKRTLVDYRISDAVMFHCLLNEGEYIVPFEIDRNDLRRAPNDWVGVIQEYPKPYVTYVGVGEMALPVRVEFFKEPACGYDLPLRIMLHACRLMPNYAFPAGLDIVDKFAKVPQWMSRPINNALAVQLLKKAIKTGDSQVISEAKRMLCGTTRDWLFRPNFDQ